MSKTEAQIRSEAGKNSGIVEIYSWDRLRARAARKLVASGAATIIERAETSYHTSRYGRLGYSNREIVGSVWVLRIG